MRKETNNNKKNQQVFLLVNGEEGLPLGLTNRAITQATLMGGKIRALLSPNRNVQVYTSDTGRSKQTAQIICNGLSKVNGYQVHEQLNYPANAESVKKLIDDCEDDIIVIAQKPVIKGLLTLLGQHNINLTLGQGAVGQQQNFSKI